MITAASTAPDGIVEHLITYDPSRFTKNETLVLCRLVAPVVSFAFALIKRNLPCRILGRDIGENLITLVKKHSPRLNGSRSTFDPDAPAGDMLQILSNWCQKEINKLLEKGWENQADSLSEKLECIVMFVDNVGHSSPVSAIISSIQSLFTADPTNESQIITLSTIHKSKGLEFHTVFLLDAPKFMPHRLAKQPWQKRQEKNLFYVAITRAKREFYYINSGCWKNSPTNPPNSPNSRPPVASEVESNSPSLHLPQVDPSDELCAPPQDQNPQPLDELTFEIETNHLTTPKASPDSNQGREGASECKTTGGESK